MLSELFNVWDLIYNFLQGMFAVFVPMVKFFFTMPFLPFTILLIVGKLASAKSRP